MNNYYKYSGYIFFSILFALSIFYLYSGYTQIKINKSFLYNKNNNEENITIKLKKNISNNLIKANPAKEENIIRDIKVKQDIEILYNVKEGDNLSNILSKFIKEKKEVRKIIIQIAKFLDPRSLRINQKIFFYHQENDLNKLIYKIIIPINNTMLLQLTRANNDCLLKKISIP